MALQVGAMQEVPQNGESKGNKNQDFCIVLLVFRKQLLDFETKVLDVVIFD